MEELVSDPGGLVKYLQEYRLQWGKPDTLSLLHSALVEKPGSDGQSEALADAEAPAYFTAETPSNFVSIIQNDWPYSGAFIVMAHECAFLSDTINRPQSHQKSNTP